MIIAAGLAYCTSTPYQLTDEYAHREGRRAWCAGVGAVHAGGLGVWSAEPDSQRDEQAQNEQAGHRWLCDRLGRPATPHPCWLAAERGHSCGTPFPVHLLQNLLSTSLHRVYCFQRLSATQSTTATTAQNTCLVRLACKGMQILDGRSEEWLFLHRGLLSQGSICGCRPSTISAESWASQGVMRTSICTNWSIMCVLIWRHPPPGLWQC
jgi:hypothetical protein